MQSVLTGTRLLNFFSIMPNTLVGLVDGSSLFKKWYFEAEVEHIETVTNIRPYLRVGWANTVGYRPFLGAGDGFESRVSLFELFIF